LWIGQLLAIVIKAAQCLGVGIVVNSFVYENEEAEILVSIVGKDANLSLFPGHE